MESKGALAIHQYYMDIINCMPNIVYWVDLDYVLKGCNANFVKWLGLKQIKDFFGTPYDHIASRLPWGAERIEAFKLDDMAVIFSGKAQYDREEPPVYNKAGEVMYYHATRVPLFDASGHVTGLLVILVDTTTHKPTASETITQHTPTKAADLAHLGEPIKVLIVEDNRVAQQVERALFMALNCQVDIAESGDAAVSLFVPGKYSIVFVDIGLQDTSGYIVSKTLRTLEKNTDFRVPIIALTSYQADVVKDDCSDYFMDGVITKPLTKEQAFQLINHYVYHDDN